jgi:hypothetical protein
MLVHAAAKFIGAIMETLSAFYSYVVGLIKDYPSWALWLIVALIVLLIVT